MYSRLRRGHEEKSCQEAPAEEERWEAERQDCVRREELAKAAQATVGKKRAREPDCKTEKEIAGARRLGRTGYHDKKKKKKGEEEEEEDGEKGGSEQDDPGAEIDV